MDPSLRKIEIEPCSPGAIFSSKFANEDNLTTPLTTPRKAPSLADSRLATLNCHVPVTTLWNGGET